MQQWWESDLTIALLESVQSALETLQKELLYNLAVQSWAYN